MSIPEFQTIFAPIHATLVTVYIAILFLQLLATRKARKQRAGKPTTQQDIIEMSTTSIKQARVQMVGGLICAGSAMVMGDVLGVIIYCIIVGMGYFSESASIKFKKEAIKVLEETEEQKKDS